MTSLLIIGTGSIGERHLRCFQSTGRCRVSACEPNDELRKTISERYGCETYSSLEDAFIAGPWDAAVICTPAHTHIPMARTCVAAGISVLIEKPLAVSLEGVEDLAAEATARQVAVRVAYVHRSIPTIMATREIAQSGRLGAVRHVTAISGQNFPTFRPAYASTYYAHRATGGGTIQDALTHIVHAVEWIVAPIESVFCDASHQALATREVEDTVNLIARLEGGIPASFVQNQFQAPNETTITLHGVQGSLRAEVHRQRVGLFLVGESDWTWTSLPAEDRDAMFVRQAEAFLNACAGQPDSLSTLAEASQTLKVNLAALKSSDRQTPQPI
jgi:predicted dehydrogenase